MPRHDQVDTWNLVRVVRGCCLLLLMFGGMVLSGGVTAAEPESAPVAAVLPTDTSRGDRMLADYFRQETARLSEACLADVKTLDDWTSQRDELRRQLFEMLGLDPLPPRTDLLAQTTAVTDHAEFTVERVHFQSRPGLYVTGNLYVPKGLTGPAPAILYLCGHGQVKKDNVAYGSKAYYQHHGAWFARNGYVCLTIDTLQLGEIEGLHHGTYRENMWWWNSRGYTPAGVEAWNAIRALDYLQSRKEVDPERIGATGRSGGGAYSWWVSALDERVKVSVPVAGITDLQNHVVDGCVEGHCDCMFMVNTYRWDYAQVAALVAPRPLLITNTDNDGIFPLDGVQRIHAQVRKIYQLYDANDKLGLQISAGGHIDSQELQVAAFHWFHRFLKGEDAPVTMVAEKLFEPEALKVFESLPADQINTKIHETFVPLAAEAALPADQAAWEQQRDAAMQVLKDQVFRGWPAEPCPLDVKQVAQETQQGLTLTSYDFTSQPGVQLRMYVLQMEDQPVGGDWVVSMDKQSEWSAVLGRMASVFGEALAAEVQMYSPLRPAPTSPSFIELFESTLKNSKGGAVFVTPRGVGLSGWNSDPKAQIQNQRRFMLLGQTLEGMQVYDVRRALQAVRMLPAAQGGNVVLAGKGASAEVMFCASLFEPPVLGIMCGELRDPAQAFDTLLNAQRRLDPRMIVALAAERTRIWVKQDTELAEWAQNVSKLLDWPETRTGVESR